MSYHLKRYHQRRKMALDYLGNKCIICGTQEQLELDHIDPSTKSVEMGKLWGIAIDRYWNEVKKCQILCRPCHINKTLDNGDNGKYHKRCGTYYSYRKGCRCLKCKEAEKQQRKKWNKPR